MRLSMSATEEEDVSRLFERLGDKVGDEEGGGCIEIVYHQKRERWGQLG